MYVTVNGRDDFYRATYRKPTTTHDKSGNVVRVKWQSLKGERYQLQRRDDLRTEWVVIAEGRATSPKMEFNDHEAAVGVNSYYRVRIMPEPEPT